MRGSDVTISLVSRDSRIERLAIFLGLKAYSSDEQRLLGRSVVDDLF